MEEWNRSGAPPGMSGSAGPPGPARGWSKGNPAPGKGQGKGRELPRVNPYTDFRLSRGSAAGAPPQPESGYGPARKGGYGQPRGHPQSPEAPRNTRPRTTSRPAGAPPARVGAGPAAHREPAGAGEPPALHEAGGPAREVPVGGLPAGWAYPVVPGPPEAGSQEDFDQQQSLGFAHGPFGRDDPKGNSWSEKYNMWLNRVVPVPDRDTRFQWVTRQGTDRAWHASLTIQPRAWPDDWEKATVFTGCPAPTKRDAREDVCRLLLEQQNLWGRVPHLTAPTSLAALAARDPGQGGAGQPAAGSTGGQAEDAPACSPRATTSAKTPPGTPRAPQQDAPAPPPAADQDPQAGGLPQEEGAGGQDTDKPDAASPGAGPAPGGPDPGDPGALAAGLLLAEAAPAACADAPADQPAAGSLSPEGVPLDPPSLPPTPASPPPDYGDGDGEGDRAAAEEHVKEEAGEEAVAEEHAPAQVEGEEAALAPAPEEEAGEAAAECHTATWLGAGPGSPPPVQQERLPVRPGVFEGEVTPPEVLLQGTPREDQQGAEEPPKEEQ